MDIVAFTSVNLKSMQIKKTLLFYTFSLFTIFQAAAQKEYNVGINALPIVGNYPLGYFSPAYYNMDFVKKKSNIWGLHIGKRWNKTLEGRSGIFVNSRKIKDECFWDLDSTSTFEIKSIRNCNARYEESHTILMLPIEIGVNLLKYKKLNSYVLGGVFLSYNILNQRIATNKLNNEKIQINDTGKQVKVGYSSKLGLKYAISKKISIYTEGVLLSDKLSIKEVYYGLNVGIELAVGHYF